MTAGCFSQAHWQTLRAIWDLYEDLANQELAVCNLGVPDNFSLSPCPPTVPTITNKTVFSETVTISNLYSCSLVGFTSSLYITLVVIVKYALIDDDYLKCKNDIENKK